METFSERYSVRGGPPPASISLQNDQLTSSSKAAAFNLPRWRKMIKMKGEMMKRRKTTQPAMTSKYKVIQRNNHTSKLPQGAFLYSLSYVSTKLLLLVFLSLFVSLALCVVVVGASRTTTATNGHSNRDGFNRIHHTDNDLRSFAGQQRQDYGLVGRLSNVYRHRASRQQRERQQRLQQNQLKYLIARTSSVPKLIGSYEQPPSQLYEQQHRQRHNDHMNNNINGYNIEQNHPSAVHRNRSEPSVSSTTRSRKHSRIAGREQRNPFFDHLHAQVERDLDGFSVGDLEPLTGDVDSLDGHLADLGEGLEDIDDDFEDVTGDGDDEDDDDEEEEEDEDDDEDDDDEGEDDDEAGDKLEDEDYAADFDGDSTRNNDQNTIPIDEANLNKNNIKDDGDAKSLPLAMTKNQLHLINHPSKYPNISKTNKFGNQVSKKPFNEPFKQLYWERHYNEVGAKSRKMVTTAVPIQLEDLSSKRQQHRLHRQKSQPLAPYQSPVVVSISDNSFVSASPINMDTSSVNEVDSAEDPKTRSEGAAVHYSHIVASPKNELPSYGRRYWHDSHMASIQMVQEEHNELDRGGINSAIIAILFGIGVTGMLIMIVSIKMRSIRERVAYKGRRRSLVPDTDFLINTIPM